MGSCGTETAPFEPEGGQNYGLNAHGQIAGRREIEAHGHRSQALGAFPIDSRPE
jgi:hypothetical protein